MAAAAKLSSELGYTFKNKELLSTALTHRSHSLAHNERLEFLGDSLLNCIIAERLYQSHPDLAEGDLSRLRAHLVKEQTLSNIAVSLRLGEALMLGVGEQKTGGMQRASILADTLEAIVGAIFLDAGFEETAKWVNALYDSVWEKIDPSELGKDPKTQLQEYLQSQKMSLPLYTIVEIQGEAHQQIFTVECFLKESNIRCHGEGSSRRNAEQVAAKNAYQLLIK